MRPLDVWRLKVFFEVAREGSTSRAAEKLNMTQSAVSRAVITLEKRIKAQLFDRVRGMRLTAQGERLYILAERIMHETDNIEKLFFEEEEIQGSLKIAALPYIATDWFIPNIKDFLKNYPHVDLQIFPLGDEIHDISNYDVAIRSFIPHQPDLFQEHLLKLNVCFFAHPEYLQEFGIPQKPRDLNKHRIVIYKEKYYTPYGNSILTLGNSINERPRKPYIQIDSLHGMIKCALNGYGIIEAPDLTSIAESGLVEVLSDIKKPEADLYFIFHKERKRSKLINELLKHLLTIKR
ncbi:MAG: LysR family transcriptional regulator [Candidatus Paracaedibacteraceae bacterium]|nr:LysR family transcriptional regulator [Candidatus Paracaedibacteraceae bacterium]